MGRPKKSTTRGTHSDRARRHHVLDRGGASHRHQFPGHLPRPPVPAHRVHGGHHGGHRPGPPGAGRRRPTDLADDGDLPGVQPHVPDGQQGELGLRRVRPGPLDGGRLVPGRLPGHRLRAAPVHRGESPERPRGGQGVGRERHGAEAGQRPARRRARRGRRVGGRQGHHADLLSVPIVRRRCALLQAQDHRRREWDDVSGRLSSRAGLV